MKLNQIISFLFPYSCPFCKTYLAYNTLLCDDCIHTLPFVTQEYDVLNGLNKMDSIDEAYGCLFYDDIVKSAILDSKSYNNKGRGYYQDFYSYANLIQYHWEDLSHFTKFDLIATIPSLKELNYKEDHGVVLAKILSRLFKIPYLKLLEKLFENEKQHLLKQEERSANVFGVFGLLPDVDLKDKSILLVDDVITTGSTANEAAKVLKIHGANTVGVLTIAVSKHKGEEKE